MKVNAYNSAQSVYFGHSEQSHRYLEEKAKNLDDKKFAQSLVKTSNLCNEMEKLIKQDERRTLTELEDWKFRAHVDLFTALKADLLGAVMSEFEDGDDYLMSEYEYYDRSNKRYKENGRYNFREHLLDSIALWDYGGLTERGKTLIDMKNAQNKACNDVIKTSKTDKVEKNNPAKEQPEEEKSETKEQTTTEIAAQLFQRAKPQDVTLEMLRDTEGSPKGFADITGMWELKAKLKDEIIDPINNPKQAELDYREYGKEIPKGVLLYGPPGCGKTFIIEALSKEIDAPVYTLDIGKSGSKYINQTANNIKASFDYVIQSAKILKKPVILFMDEIDSMTMNRTSDINDENLKQVATLLKSIEQAQKNNVIVVGASNRYNLIDPAIIRRFPLKQFVGAPNQEQRKELLQNTLKNKEKAQKLLGDEEGLDKIAKMLEGYSYSAINIISQDAALNALRRNRADISLEDYKKAINNTNEQKAKSEEYQEKKQPKIGFESESL